MPRRNNYGLNFQTINGAKFFELLPLSYMEVVPGDTITGTIKSRLFSDTTKVPMLNRTYFDTFAFYIPFRLIDDTFPDFIAGNGGSVPTLTSIFRENFENTNTVHAAWRLMHL